MPNLTLETSEAEKPILFIVGEKNPLIAQLVEKFKSDFKVALVSSTDPPPNPKPQTADFFHINPTNAALIKNLKEKIDYAIVFCEDQKIKEYIGPILEKFADDKTKTTILCDINSFDEFADVALATQQASSFYFVITGDVYSEDPAFNPDSPTTNLVNSALYEKEAIVTGNDLSPLFPIYLPDAITGISQLLLSPKKKSRYFFLFYDHPQTYISALHILERIEPDLKITYQDAGMAERYEDRSILDKTIEEKVGEKVASLDKYFDGFEKSIKYFLARGKLIKKEVKPNFISVSKEKIQSEKSSIKFFGKSVFFAILLFLIISITAAIGSVMLLKNSLTEFKKGQFQESAMNAKTAKVFYELVESGAEIISTAVKNAGNKSLDKNLKLYSTATNMAFIAASDINGITQINSEISQDQLSQNIADAVYIYFLTQKLSTETKNQNIISFVTPEMSSILSLAQVAPEVLGFGVEKHYLLLFQNDGELRPTGGFIGSVGELTLKNGKIADLTLQDVYAYDGQLKIHVEPHYVIRRNIQQHLFLRDSNFDPDFQESAITSALIYNLETKRKVDGVIAVNFEAVRQIIGSLQPIDLTSYKISLNRNNAFDFLESTIDNKFFPGSTAKKDVLQALFDKIMLQLENKNNLIKVARLIPQLAVTKDILFAFNQGPIQNAFSSVGFAGEMSDNRKISSSQINDYLSVNEANIGTNKANIKVSRSIEYSPTISQNKINSKITYNISNQSGVVYKTYIRIFTPLSSSILSIKIDGKEQNIIQALTDYKIYEKRNFKVPSGLELSQEIESGKTVFGFITEVQSKSQSKIEIEYNNGVNIPHESVLDYSLLFNKQPGIKQIPFVLNLIYGNDFTPKKVQNASLENGVIVMKKDIERDIEFEAELLRR